MGSGKMNKEDVLLKEIRELGYECMVEYDGEDLVYIDIIPQRWVDGSYRVNQDVVNLLKEYGFEFENLITKSKMLKEFNGMDTMAVFYNTALGGDDDEQDGV
jgi:hypothetical protein